MTRDAEAIERYERESQERLAAFLPRYQSLAERTRSDQEAKAKAESDAFRRAEQEAERQRQEQRLAQQHQEAVLRAEAEELLRDDGTAICDHVLPEQTLVVDEHDPELKGPIIWPDLKGVYFALTEPNIVKIGFSTNIYQRMVQHQGSVIRTLIPLILYIPGDRALESAIKDEFYGLRASSDTGQRELFYYREMLQTFIDDQRKMVLGLGPYEAGHPAIQTSYRGLPDWFRKHHSKAQNHTCQGLLNQTKFRSSGRQNLRKKLEAWLETGPKGSSPFTIQEWRYLTPWIER